MMKKTSRLHCSGFTLVELLITITIAAIILAIAIPSFRDFIVLERLKSVNAQLITDIQYARSEALSKNTPVYWSSRSLVGVKSCYSIYTTTTPGLFCLCTLGAGSACPNSAQTELKTVEILDSSKIKLTSISNLDFAIDNATGGLIFGTTDFADPLPTPFEIKVRILGSGAWALRTTISPAGRPTVCSSGSRLIAGFESC